MEKLVSELAERLNLPPDQVSKVVDGVMDYLKKNPDAAASLLGSGGGVNISKKLGGLFRR
ncbi:hypothetical protein EDM76_01845 [bacterium]|nr:MAG: hypothetical protein EDM76_01845 [bacterium]MCL4229963.1 hypothetical protein [Dehalococcoidia bacterium]